MTEVSSGNLIVDAELVSSLKYASDGLLPAVVVDEGGQVLMVAYMDSKALSLTLETSRTWFYSRSRREYWAKGETSGNVQRVIEVKTDCDRDTLLVRVHQEGSGACHTGAYSCFFEILAHIDGEEIAN